MKSVVLINSRQALRPTGNTRWVSSTIHAVNELSSSDEIQFLTSLGTASYELTLTLLTRTSARIVVCLTNAQANRYGESEAGIFECLVREYGIDPERVSLRVIPSNPSDDISDENDRDRYLLNISDEIYPISVRPSGFFEREIRECNEFAEKTNRRFETVYERAHETLKMDYSARRLNPETCARLEGHLVHWTRSSNSAWPGERRAEYYRAVCDSTNRYPRLACATLKRILSEQRLRGSRRHSPGNASITSFTAGDLHQSRRMMHYRARYREMTCEPYGIAIPISLAKELGAKAVKYLCPDEIRDAPEDERLFVHACGEETNWDSECEWRLFGDVDLKRRLAKIVVLVESTEVVDEIRKKYGVETRAVFE